jgi:PAS domain S-box-containing protein
MAMTSESDKINILICDDLPDKRLVLETVLAELGENVISARSGPEALQQVLRHDFAVILLDVNMPGMDGLETAALIRQRKKSAHTPIIFVTAYVDDLRTSQGYSLGAVDYMLSPLVPDVLRSKVKVFVDLYRMTQEVRRHAEERVALARAQAAREAAEEAAAAIREREERFRLASEAVNGFIYEVDPRTGRAILSPGVKELLDFSPDEAQTFAWWEDRIHVDDLPSLRKAREAALRENRRSYRYQYRARHRDGHYLHVWDQGLIVRDGDGSVIRLVGNVVDMTEQKRAEHALAEANRRKDEFLSMLGHELRNPLAPIKNALKVMLLRPIQDPQFLILREMIDRNVTQLVRLVDDLLDVSRITQGKIRVCLEPVELRAVVTQAVEVSASLIEERSHKLSITMPKLPITILGDSTRLTQVVSNLLNNAAKYTDVGGQIWLSLAQESGDAIVRIRDTGVGLATEQLESVFEPFKQVERSIERSEGGLGIGLTLVRRLVDLHGGKVFARSEGLGQGSEFMVQFPLAGNGNEANAVLECPRVSDGDA